MRLPATLGAAVLMAGAGAAFGQGQPGSPRPATGQPAARADDAGARHDRLVRAGQLPAKAEEIRRRGVPDSEVKEALDAAKAKRVPAGEMAGVADSAAKDVDQHGRIDNFGHFVKSKLDQGLRGRDLANAIHEEHARRGMGKANAKHNQGNAAKGGDDDKPQKPEKAGKPQDRDDDKGQPEERGKPDKSNKSGGQGKGHGKPG